jgi:hypothetical protein
LNRSDDNDAGAVVGVTAGATHAPAADLLRGNARGQQAARKPLLAIFGPAFLVWLASTWPLVFGLQTYTLRDVFLTHYGFKTAQVAAWNEGRIPLVDLHRGGGQASLGNPNGLPLYPDNLLYLLGDSLWALNAHFLLHWLAAALALYVLGRAWGLPKESSAIGGLLYATSGYMVSQLNLYNSIAAAAIAPAFVAAVLRASADPGADPRRGARWSGSGAAAAGLWALLVLGGEPFLAATALAMAGFAVLLRGEWRARRLAKLVVGLALGTLLALPQLVETWRILPASYRAMHGVSAADAVRQSFDPRWAVDWLLPLFFGEPGHYDRLLSQRLSSGEPLYYTLFPGVGCLLLASLAWRRGGRREVVWSSWMMGGGLFLALGRFNPLLAWVFETEWVRTFRYPIRFLLPAAVGVAILGAAGHARLASDTAGTADATAERRWRRMAVALLAIYLCLGSVAFVGRGAIERLFADLFGVRGSTAMAGIARSRWMLAALIAAGTVVALFAVAQLARRRRALGAPLMGAVIVASQLALLRDAMPTDATAAYRVPSPILEALPTAARVLHEADYRRVSRLPWRFPTDESQWLSRHASLAGLAPFAEPRRLRYELAISAERLHSYRLGVANAALQQIEPARRFRLGRALGITHWVMESPPSAQLATQATSILQTDLWGYPIGVFALRDPVPEFLATASLRFGRDRVEELRLLTAEEFDPRTLIVLSGTGAATAGGVGTVSVLRQEAEHVTAEVALAEPGYFLVQRAHLPIYRATVDGREAAIALANLYRMAVPVPAGTHRVELWVDRRPTNVAFAVSVGALLTLVALAVARRW